jgi:hypothetical protein
LKCFKAKRAENKTNAVFDGGLFHGIGSNPKKIPPHQDEDLKIQLKRRFDAPMHTASKQFQDLSVPASEELQRVCQSVRDSPALASSGLQYSERMRMDGIYCNRP